MHACTNCRGRISCTRVGTHATDVEGVLARGCCCSWRSLLTVVIEQHKTLTAVNENRTDCKQQQQLQRINESSNRESSIHHSVRPYVVACTQHALHLHVLHATIDTCILDYDQVAEVLMHMQGWPQATHSHSLTPVHRSARAPHRHSPSQRGAHDSRTTAISRGKPDTARHPFLGLSFRGARPDAHTDTRTPTQKSSRFTLGEREDAHVYLTCLPQHMQPPTRQRSLRFMYSR
jgi:hypothetical protein